MGIVPITFFSRIKRREVDEKAINIKMGPITFSNMSPNFDG